MGPSPRGRGLGSGLACPDGLGQESLPAPQEEGSLPPRPPPPPPPAAGREESDESRDESSEEEEDAIAYVDFAAHLRRETLVLGTTRRRPLGSLVDPSGGGGGEEDGEEEEAAVGVAGPWRRAVGRSHSGDGELGRLLDARARMQQQHEATRTTVQSETAALMDSGVRVT